MWRPKDPEKDGKSYLYPIAPGCCRGRGVPLLKQGRPPVKGSPKNDPNASASAADFEPSGVSETDSSLNFVEHGGTERSRAHF